MKNNIFVGKKNILLICFALLLVLSAGLFFGLSSTKTASAASDDIHTEWYYAETENGYSVDYVYSEGIYADINNSSAVLSKTYYFTISETIYNQLSDFGNHFAVVFGKKEGMDYLYQRTARTVIRDEVCRGFSGYFSYNEFTVFGPETLQSCFPNNCCFGEYVQLLYQSDELPRYANFPYVAKELQKSDVRVIGGNLGTYYRIPIPVTWAEGNLFDIGIYLVYQYNTSVSVDTRVVAYYTDSTIVSEVEDVVLHAGRYRDQSFVGAFEKALGIYRSGNVEVEYSYLRMQDGDHFNKFETVTSSISVPAYLVPDSDWIRDRIYGVNGSSGLSGFNVDYVPTISGVLENGNYVEKEVFGRRTVRQATGFNYGYSFYNGQGGVNQIPDRVRNSEITYNPYVYGDFWVRIANVGDLEQIPDNYFENNLYIDVYHTSYFENTTEGRMYLYYDYQTIINLFERSLHWAIKDNAFRLDIRGNYDSSVVTVEELRNEANKATGFAVSFPYSSKEDKAAQPCLQSLEVTGLASITAPIEVDCTVEYKVLNEDFSESTQSFNLDHKYWTAAGDSSKVTLTNLSDDLLLENGTWAYIIYGSIQPAAFDGIKYMRPSRVDVEIDFHNKTAVLTVGYSYNSRILKITNDLNDDFWLVNLSESVAIYSLSSLGVAQYIPEGYRIGSIQSVDGFQFENKDLGNPLNTTFYKDGSTRNEPYRMTVHLTDKWPVNITYYERFNNSPFFVKTVVEKQLRVADYDIFALTSDIVRIILGKETLNLFELSMVERVNVNYDNQADTYYVTLDYSSASLKGKDYNGNDDEIKVPLTCYADWTASFGKAWSVMMLNDTANHYFKNTDGIKPDMLYGFFSVAVFRERVTDLNYWFQSYTANGCKTCFTSKEVKGSEIYEFFGNWDPVLGYPYMAFCELFNKNDAMYYSYFFYMDGSTDLAFLAINGADDYDDNDSALKNKAQDVGESIGDFFSSIWDKIKNSTVVKVIAIVGAVILGIIVLSLVIKLIMIIFRRR